MAPPPPPAGHSGPAARRVALLAACAVLVATIAGPFGTLQALGWPSRLMFWSAILGWNAAKWLLWARLLAARAKTPRARLAVLAAGGILLNALLPFEIAFAFEAVGKRAVLDFTATYLAALGLSAAILAARFVVPGLAARTQPAPTPTPGPGPERPLFARAGIARAEDVLAALAEDHYLRLHLADGRRPLILYRFGDALRDLAGLDGEQVHRGAWVSAAAVAGSEREGRKWRLRLHDGTLVPVSESHVGAARRRGWLR